MDSSDDDEIYDDESSAWTDSEDDEDDESGSVSFGNSLDSNIEAISHRVSNSQSGQNVRRTKDRSDVVTWNRERRTRKQYIKGKGQRTDRRAGKSHSSIPNMTPGSSAMSPALLSREGHQELSAVMANVAGTELNRNRGAHQHNIVINNPQLYLTKKTELSAPRARNVNLGGTQNIQTTRQEVEAPDREESVRRQRNKDPKDPRLNRLTERTKAGIKTWTHGMVRTSFVDTITKKIHQGENWITITGNAGDGKTTAGYMVLADMVKRGKEVIHIKDPAEYYLVTEHMSNAVLMLNDVLGAFSFDPTLFSKWGPVIYDVLDNIDKSRENGHSNNVTVLFVTRLNVLQGGRDMFDKYGNDIFDKSSVINVGEVHEHFICERLQILEYHLNRTNITDVTQEEKQRVISGNGIHGFPHCCKLYADLTERRINIEEFFCRPLQFLNGTTKALCQKEENEVLFKHLLQRDGRLDVNKIEREDLRQQVHIAATSLIGSYLLENHGIITFSHPSIYESVAFCIAKKDVTFAIKQFSFSFLMQKMKFVEHSTSDDSNFICIQPTESNIARLCERFSLPFLYLDFEVLRHEFLNDDLCERVLTSVTARRTWHLCICLRPRSSKLHIDETDKNGNTLLHVAMTCGNVTAIRVLLKQGANVKMNIDGYTCFLYLCQHGKPNCETIKLFHKHGSNVNEVTRIGLTPLHYLCLNENADESTITLLIKLGADMTKADILGCTPFHYLCQSEKAGESLIPFLLKHRINVNKPDRFGFRPLHYLCRNEKVNDITMIAMIKSGAEVTKANKSGWTPLHYLCTNKSVHENLLDMLVKNSANVNRSNKSKNKPLHYLCENKNASESSISLLVHNGAKLIETNRFGSTPLHCLCGSGNADRNSIELMVKKGADVNRVDNSRYTPLHALCRNEDISGDSIHTLIAYGADVNKASVDGSSPLHYLCANKKADGSIIDMLIRQGAEVNTVDSYGWTPLHYLCANEESMGITIASLIRHGADKSIVNNHGYTPLQYLHDD